MRDVYYSIFKKLAATFALIALAAGVATLMGWQYDIDTLKRPISHLVAMNPLTAVGIILTAAAILLRLRPALLQRLYIKVGWINIVVIIFCFTNITQTLLHSAVRIDHFLFSQTLTRDALVNLSNNMAITTGLCFILLNIALVLGNKTGTSKTFLPDTICIVVALLSLFAIIGYSFKVNEFYSTLVYLPMALTTAISFMLLSLAILFHQPHKGVAHRLANSFAGSTSARLLLTASILIPFLLGLLILNIHWKTEINTELSVAVLVFSLIVVFIFLVWHNTTLLIQKEKNRMKAEEALRVRTEELAAANEELLKTNEKLKEFAYIASHDLQEPLRKIGIFSGLAKNTILKNETEKSLEYIDKMKSSSAKMISMVTNLLDYSKLLNDRQDRNYVDLTTLLTEITNEFKDTVDKDKIKIVTENLEPVAGNAVQLRQVFENLIGNSIKFAKKDEPLHITIRPLKEPDIMTGTSIKQQNKKDGFQLIEVRDTGIGFEQQQSEKIFNMFARLHGKQEFKGTGIGLSIVRKIVENHDGQITAFSTPGEGAVFKILLPLFKQN